MPRSSTTSAPPETIRAKAMAQFCGILTQEQKDKLGNRVGNMMDGMGAFQRRRHFHVFRQATSAAGVESHHAR